MRVFYSKKRLRGVIPGVLVIVGETLEVDFDIITPDFKDVGIVRPDADEVFTPVFGTGHGPWGMAGVGVRRAVAGTVEAFVVRAMAKHTLGEDVP